ncbi:MAG: DUF6249 domain-containing protein [Prevotella sp.]|jgi:hypothetical protein
MKKIIFTLALLCALSGQAAGVQPKHRAHQKTEQVDQNVNQKADDNTDADNNSEGIEAYSDTTYVDTTDIDSAYSPQVYIQPTDDEDMTDDAKFLSKFFDAMGSPVKGLFIFMLFATCIIFLLAPVIIVALILRYLIKRHNSKVQLAEQAIASGQPLPHETVPSWSIEGKWQKGVRNVAIGVGLALMFLIMGAEEIAGVGLLIACIGGGQMYTAKKLQQQHGSDTTREHQHNFYTDTGFYGESTGRTDQPDSGSTHSTTEQQANTNNGDTTNHEGTANNSDATNDDNTQKA